MQTFSLALTLFFVLDPFGNLPFVLGLLNNVDKKRRRIVIIRELIIALLILLVFYFGGPWFLDLLDVGSSDLKISGGVVLGIIALRMVFPDEGQSNIKDSETEPFVVPLAIPLIAGPSSLATVMIIAAQSSSNTFLGMGMISLAWLANAIILFLGVILGYYIPQRLLNALERLSGLLLAVIAVRMLMTGIQTYFQVG